MSWPVQALDELVTRTVRWIVALVAFEIVAVWCAFLALVRDRSDDPLPAMALFVVAHVVTGTAAIVTRQVWR